LKLAPVGSLDGIITVEWKEKNTFSDESLLLYKTYFTIADFPIGSPSLELLIENDGDSVSGKFSNVMKNFVVKIDVVEF
jgi:hypothetical protein